MATKTVKPQDNLIINEDEIILNGPPGKLIGKINMANHNKEITRLRTVDVNLPTGKKSSKKEFTPMFMNVKLRPGEQRVKQVSLSLLPDTPPGTYETSVDLGGKKRKVKLIVQPTISIEVYPTEFTFQGTAPGTVHTALFTVTNLGNLPFQVPEIKHVGMLDMDMLCRAFGFGFRDSGDAGFNETMDSVTKNIKENLPEWAKAKVAQAGNEISPGQSMLIDLTITLSRNVSDSNDYNLLARFWDVDLAIDFKSHKEIP